MDGELDRVLRVRRSKEVAKRSYDRLSRWYDLLASSSEWKYTRQGLQMLAAKEGEHILEIGFGTGNALLSLAKDVGESGSITGIDISEGMLKIAQQKLQKADLDTRVKLDCGDGANLLYDASEFDAVFMSFTLELFDTPEILQALKGCHRVLKPEGRLAVVAMVKKERDNLAVKLYEWAHEAFPNYIDCRPILLRSALETSDFNLQQISEHTMWGLPLEIALATKRDAPRMI
jgi:demethylmenaquinone methyltransferase/2-methoxy-6-polyprenyl-1,4-benzoquinol methylase